MQPKHSKKKQTKIMHWAARFAIRYGTVLSLLLLLFGFFFPKGSFFAISVCKSAVFSFAVSVIGGLMLDVISVRLGADE